MRATGDNPQMIRALGSTSANDHPGPGPVERLIALCGALLAQYQGFADVQMGIGMVVWGLASVIIGEALTGSRSLRPDHPGAVMGSVLFRLLVAIALRWGLNPNDLKLITARFVFAALMLPGLLARTEVAAPRIAAMLEVQGIRKTFNPDTLNEVRALRGVDLRDRGGLLCHRHRHQRLRKIHLLNAVAGALLPRCRARSGSSGTT